MSMAAIMKDRTTRTLVVTVGIFASLALLAVGAEVPERPTSTAGASGPVPQLAGSSACRECHASFYEKWATSHHGLAMQPFTADLKAGQRKPQSRPIMVRDHRYRVELAGGRGWVVESGPNEEKRHAMEHAWGGKNVFYFLTPRERGRLQVLPVAYDVRRQEWFDTTGSAARGQMHFEDEVLDWRVPQLTFSTLCHGCHTSSGRYRFTANSNQACLPCHQAHALESQEPKFTYTLAFYLYARGARDEAVTLLRTVTDRRTAYLDAYMLLGRMYEEGGRKNDAIELYQRAAAVEQFPTEVRQQFSARAQRLSQGQ